MAFHRGMDERLFQLGLERLMTLEAHLHVRTRLELERLGIVLGEGAQGACRQESNDREYRYLMVKVHNTAPLYCFCTIWHSSHDLAAKGG